MVEVDASSSGLRAILSQRQGDPPKLFLCAYHSRKLTMAEINYDVGDREQLAMKAAFEEWWHWLEGAKHPFTVLTDHKNLEYLRTAKRLNSRQARWFLFFSCFQFTITYRPGSKNMKADTLSRQSETDMPPQTPETVIPSKLVISPIQWDISTEIDQHNAHNQTPRECPINKVFVPEPLRECLIEQMHCYPSSGHPGITDTIHLTRNQSGHT